MVTAALLTLALVPVPVAVEGECVAFTHVELVTMRSEVALSDQTILVEGDTIVASGPADEVALPEGCVEIDGRGLYLMPGLADMHVHTWAPQEHVQFVASGVTTVRNMFGSPVHLTWRDEIAAGKRLGPTLYTAGPIVDGKPAFWPNSIECVTGEDGLAAVDLHVDKGYDFVKVYSGLPLAAFDDIVGAAGDHGVPVMGHVPSAVGLDRSLAAGQRTIEHFTEIAQHLVPPEVLEQRTAAIPMGLDLWEQVDPERFEPLVERIREAGTWNCPTLIVFQKWLGPDEIELEVEKPHMQYVPQWSIGTWRRMAAGIPAEMRDAARRGDDARKALVRALHEGGARLLLGTDMGNPFVAAGVSVHWELQNFVDAGLTPYEALRTATYEAAACMQAAGEFGAVAPGLRADLVLVEGNPLEDVANAARIRGVMVRGRWLPREELDELLESGSGRPGGGEEEEEEEEEGPGEDER